MFVDTRLHISVCPLLEYKIPEWCCLVRDVALDQRPSGEVRRTLQECLDRFQNYAPSERSPSSRATSEETSEEERTVHKAFQQTVTQLHSYLTLLANAWLSYVNTTVMRLNRRVLQLRSEYDACRRELRGSAETYRDVLLQLRQRLNGVRQEILSHPPPDVRRPASLHAETQRLRQLVAEHHGRLSTRRMLHLKRDFEHRVHRMQAKLARNVVRQLFALIDPTPSRSPRSSLPPLPPLPEDCEGRDRP